MVGVAGTSPDWNVSRANKIVRFILTALQLLCITGAFVLNDLRHKKVGVNHHVVYRKQQYMQTILDTEHRLVYGILPGLFLAVIWGLEAIKTLMRLSMLRQ